MIQVSPISNVVREQNPVPTGKLKPTVDNKQEPAREQPDVVLELSGSKPEELTYSRPSATEITRMREEAESKYNYILELIKSLASKQAGIESGISPAEGVELEETAVLVVPPEVAAWAQEALESYYSVEQTSNRIMDMARALSGGDKSKIPLLRKAVQDGFEQVQQILGELPQISKDTYNEIMRQFDEWEKEA
jgi:hypothetical protein